MAPKTPVCLRFQRPEGRADFERARRELRAALPNLGAGEGAERLLELAATLDAGVARCKRELVGSSLCWNDDNRAVIAWVGRQHRALLEMGVRLAEALRREPGVPLDLERVAAACLHAWGEVRKWTLARERPDYRQLHDLLLLGASTERRRAAFAWVVDGRAQQACLESLYFRALLLDRFASGSLTGAQLELLDAWLWEWSAVLEGHREPPPGPYLRVDVDLDAGLRNGARTGEGASLYLALGPLEAERRKLVRSMHRGRMVPTHGCAAELRIEEHVALLDHLKGAFREPVDEARQRAPRQPAAGTRVEVWVGLQEILARGMSVGIETGRWRTLDLQDAAIAEQSRARFADASRRYLWLVDASASGLGFEALETDAGGIEAGDLVGWRRTLGGPVVLGQVVRRMPGAHGGQVFLGVRLLSEAAQPLTLSQDLGREADDATYLFVPGDDNCGRHDAFLVPEGRFDLRASYHTRIGASAFTLQLNRVRGRGRGWILAGFEVLPAGGGALDAARAPELTLEPQAAPADDEPTSHAWDHELSARLLS
jgi:hypothetical protein